MQQDLFETAFKYSSIAMALVSPEGKWLKVNQALLDYLGYEEDEFLVLDFLQMTHPEDLKADLDLVNETLMGKRNSYLIEKRYIHKNGTIVYGLLSVSIIRNSDGTPRFFISQIQDLTELKQTQLNLQMNSKLIAVGEMSAGIAHEINNPLAIINLNSRALEQIVAEKEIDRPMIKYFAKKISETVDRIDCIVSSLRKLSYETKQVDAFELCPIEVIVEDALGLCYEKFRGAGVKLSLNIPEDLMLECNPIDISQVLINLLNNAFYAVKDCPHKEISIGATTQNQMLILNVMDSGVGISKDIQDRVLDPFFTTKPVGQGTGLGLSISKSIVRSHAGTMYLDKNCEKTNFVVKLPLKQAHSSKSTDAFKGSFNN